MNRRDFLKFAPASISAASFPALAASDGLSFRTKIAAGRVVVSPDGPDCTGWERCSLQEAMDFASRRDGVLDMLPGVYRVSELVIDAPLAIRGTPRETVIEPVGADAATLDIHPAGGEKRLRGVSLHGLIFRGKSLPYRRAVDAAQRPIHTLPYVPERFNGLVAAYRSDGLTIADCAFDGAVGAAIALWECHGADVARNRIADSRVALFSHAGRGNVFADNILEETVDLGVYVAHHA